MDSDLRNLKEWAPLTDLLNKLPSKIQKGFFYIDFKITCIDVVPEFIALGTDVGILFWYNRENGELQKLRSEFKSPITCVQICSSVEFMVAAGSESGQVSVFQIQKKHPPDLNLDPLTKSKPIQRYTIRDLHNTPIKCVEWSKNGMKLFSGDKTGIIVLTEFDFSLHLSKSLEILNEAYEIVQISFQQSYLLISTVFRAIVCQKTDNNDGKWNVSQIGKKDRKILSEFGATFCGQSRQPSIICSRPGFRFWLADTSGNVSQTLLFKDALTKSCMDVKLLNPGRLPINLPRNFGYIYLYKNNFIITRCDKGLYILDLEKLCVIATVKKLRGIESIAVCGNEIFILEGPRSIIRLSTEQDNICYKNLESFKEVTNQNFTEQAMNTQKTSYVNDLQQLFEPSEIEIEADEESVINAEECFELPPIEHICLDIPQLEHRELNQFEKNDDLFLEHSRKIEVYDRINELTYDESILFKSANGKKNHKARNCKGTSSKSKIEGIVEIGQQADIVEQENKEKLLKTSCSSASQKQIIANKETQSCLMDISVCDYVNDNIIAGVIKSIIKDANISYGPDLRSPGTLQRDIEIKEKKLAEALNIEPIKLETIQYDKSVLMAGNGNNPTVMSMHSSFDKIKTPDLQFIWQYKLSSDDLNCSDNEQKISLKKIHFISDDDILPTPVSEENKLNELTNLCDDDKKHVLTRSDITNNCTLISSEQNNCNITNDGAILVQTSLYPPSAANEVCVPEVKKMPEYMNIPNLWNVRNNENNDMQNDISSLDQQSDNSDWEIIDM